MVTDWQQCPKLFEFRYVQNRRSESPAMERGNVVHRVLHRLLEHVPPQDRTLEQALVIAGEEIEVCSTNFDSLFGPGEQQVEAVRTWVGEVLLSVHQYFKLEDPAAHTTAINFEMWLSARLPQASGELSTIVGRLDRLDRQRLPGSPEEVITIVDYKTKSLSLPYSKEDWQQLAIYASVLVLQGTYQGDKLGGRLLYLGKNPGDCSREFTEADLARAQETVQRVRAEILEAAKSPGGFCPRPSRLCDWCSFQSECPAFAMAAAPARVAAQLRTPTQHLRPDIANGVAEAVVANGISTAAPPGRALPALAHDTVLPTRAEHNVKKVLVPVPPLPDLWGRDLAGHGIKHGMNVEGAAADAWADPSADTGARAERRPSSSPAACEPRAAMEDSVGAPQLGEPFGDGTTVVSTREDAERVSELLMGLREAGRFHAIDTETVGWDPMQTPYGRGQIVGFSVFCGRDVDFGSGPRLWIETLGDAKMVEYFREYLEDAALKKVFHNFAFDRAMFKNMGVSVAGFAGDTMHMARLWHSDLTSFSLEELSKTLLDPAWQKHCSFGALLEKGFARDFSEMLADPATRDGAIEYATLDSVATWKLHETLAHNLRAMPWDGWQGSSGESQTMLDFYDICWRPLAEVLVSIEEQGVQVDIDHLLLQERRATEDYEKVRQHFVRWVQHVYAEAWPEDSELIEHIGRFNPASSKQLGQLLCGGIKGSEATIVGLRIRSLGIPAKIFSEKTKGGAVSTGNAVLTALSGPNPAAGREGCGKALSYIGEEGCMALASLAQMKSVCKTLSTFLKPLQRCRDAGGRVHTSLNLNTVTGRLSSRNPNLQQQPALEKDGYEIRKAFRCNEGRRLIVADYAQLELRVLAHLTGCRSLMEALSSDGDIHSRTALDMYDHIRLAVERGEVVLEGGDGSVPTVKEAFPIERRRAKTLNFGIMYGLQGQGLSKQIGCSVKEADETIKRWFDSRPEVLAWQRRVLEDATRTQRVQTLRGRSRPIEKLTSKNPYERSEAARQAINTPAQGGSADIVVEAMLRLHNCRELREDLGYTTVLQVHDELILEGPEEHAARALELVRDLMEHPFLDGSQLAVPLPVDAHVVRSWNEAKG